MQREKKIKIYINQSFILKYRHLKRTLKLIRQPAKDEFFPVCLLLPKKYTINHIVKQLAFSFILKSENFHLFRENFCFFSAFRFADILSVKKKHFLIVADSTAPRFRSELRASKNNAQDVSRLHFQP